MTKTLNHIFFFLLHQNQNIFFSNIGNQNIFLEKNHSPPLQVKWSFPKDSHFLDFKINKVLDFIISANKGNNKITELRTILQRESQNS
jgi:hypothetical protein